MPERAIIRTSDRQAFKRCRRKWSLSSHLHHNRTQSEQVSYFWFGTGCHYALEDFHGYNYYKHPAEAFRAYVTAQRQFSRHHPEYKLPYEIDEFETLGCAMMDYYVTYWLATREVLETLWWKGEPQCEVQCTLLLPYQNEHYNEVFYQFTLDRVVVIDGELWIVDYKFYNRDWSSDLDLDAQMSAYIWAGQTIYDRPIKGAIMQKHFKAVPGEPRILSNGRLSADSKQNTTYAMYKRALEEMYTEIERAPLANRNCLQELMQMEGFEKDPWIQRERTERTEREQETEGESVLLELPEMLNPELPLYKSRQMDCTWCNFKDVCLAMDDGLDWESMLYETTVGRNEDVESWRTYLPHVTQA